MAGGKRLASLDALRGFDMFFIMGGAGLIAGVCAALGCGGCWLARQMNHVPWAGLAHHDTIFPLFLFLAGVSWPFSLAAQRERGRTAAQIHLKLIGRAAALFLIGLSFGGILKFVPTFRVPSVLGYIGLSWGVAALLYMHLGKVWQRALVMALMTLGYFSLLHFCIMPGAPDGADPYSYDWNIVRYLDLHLMPNHLYKPGVYDPESLCALPTGVVLAMLGMSAGSLLRSETLSPVRKTAGLFAAALGSLALALLSVFVVGVPIVKALWTVSFIFAAAAYSFAMLALFYWLVDVKGWKRWTIAFDPIGKNSILVYTMAMIGVTGCICGFLFTGVTNASGDWKRAVGSLGSLLVTWAVARFCQRHDIYLKV